MASSLNNQQAAFYGQFVACAVEMYTNNPGNLTPPAPSDFPSGYNIVAWANAVDKWGGTNVNSFYGLVAQATTGNQEVIIAIRGTQNALEWLIDLEICPTPFAPIPQAGKVEKGFFSVFDTLTFVTENGSFNLPSFLANQSQVTVIGHSLGSSLVTMLGLTLIQQNAALASTMTIYTLASPAVGDSTFAKYFNSTVTQSFRIWNELDLVPRILNWAYTQVGGDGNELIQSWSEFKEIRLTPTCEHIIPTYLFLLDPSAYAPSSECHWTIAEQEASDLFNEIRAKQ